MLARNQLKSSRAYDTNSNDLIREFHLDPLTFRRDDIFLVGAKGGSCIVTFFPTNQGICIWGRIIIKYNHSHHGFDNIGLRSHSFTYRDFMNKVM